MGLQKAGRGSYGSGSNVGWVVSDYDFLVGCLGVQGKWLCWNNIVGRPAIAEEVVRGLAPWRIKRRYYCDLYHWVCMARAFCTSIETTIR